MKTVKITLWIIVMLTFSGLNEAMSQWSTSGTNIYNTNTGNVGIGNSAPASLLHVGKTMTEPTIRVQNFGGFGGASFQMIDDVSGANWKFKATLTGGFKIRDNAFALDVIVIEPNSSANAFYINATGNVGLGTATPAARLDVSGADALVNGLTVGLGGGAIAGNTAFGTLALDSNTTGAANTAVGTNTLSLNTEGYWNTAVGAGSMQNTTTGNNNTAIGTNSLLTNSLGSVNTAVGGGALYANTEGIQNVAIGYFALVNNITGGNNVATGVYALGSNTSGVENVATGASALNFNTIGVHNVAIGSQALNYNISGHENTAIGSLALFSNDTGSYNVAIGRYALYSNTEGYYNTALGTSAGESNSEGNGNVFLGYRAGYFETGSDKLYIANSDTATPLIGGDFSTNEVTINDVLTLTPRATAPSSPSEGMLYVNSTDSHIYCYLGGIWVQLD